MFDRTVILYTPKFRGHPAFQAVKIGHLAGGCSGENRYRLTTDFSFTSNAYRFSVNFPTNDPQALQITITFSRLPAIAMTEEGS